MAWGDRTCELSLNNWGRAGWGGVQAAGAWMDWQGDWQGEHAKLLFKAVRCWRKALGKQICISRYSDQQASNCKKEGSKILHRGWVL